MQSNLIPLYWGTAIMLIFSVFTVISILNTTMHRREQKAIEIKQEVRAKFLNERMTQIEDMIRNEIGALIKVIKKTMT
jgi:sensor domain CHASE-containing protein